MAWLLNLAYLLLLTLVSPWLMYQSWRTGKYRRGWREKFLGQVPKLSNDRFRVWFHAVSVGEINLLGPLLTQLQQAKPDWECVISTTTDTGYELARQKYSDHTVFYCPLDFSWAVKRALRNLRPSMLVLAELELWPNLIREASAAGVKVAVVNARLSESSFRGYRRLGALMRSVLSRINGIAAQNEEYTQRFRDLGVPPERVLTSGSIKFDNARTNRHNADTQSLRRLAGIQAAQTVFLAGSTQSPEEELAIETYRALRGDHPKLRLVLVPRHPERFDEVARLLEASGLPWVRRSALKEEEGVCPSSKDESPILLVDTVGELGAWWGLTQIAFVGGSMGTRGGQNMIEPAGYGAAVSFGPKTKNFHDVVAMMLQANCARVVNDRQEMADFVRWCLEQPAAALEMGQRAASLVVSQQGATQRTIGHLLQIAESMSELRSRAA